MVVTHQAEKIWIYDRKTDRPTVQAHGEVANENPLILPRTLSIVGALVLLKRRANYCSIRRP